MSVAQSLETMYARDPRRTLRVAGGGGQPLPQQPEGCVGDPSVTCYVLWSYFYSIFPLYMEKSQSVYRKFYIMSDKVWVEAIGPDRIGNLLSPK